MRIRKAYEKLRQTEGVSLASGVIIKIGRYFMRFQEEIAVKGNPGAYWQGETG